MTRYLRLLWSDERGGTLAVVAVMLAAVLSMMALAIDLGMLYTARSEAQRVADSAALAGASAFLDYTQQEAPPRARERALDFAAANHVRNVRVDEAEVTVEVVPAAYRVRVWVRREGIPTWFARFFGVLSQSVVGYAAAEAAQAGAANCLAPVAIPDIWHETQYDTNYNRIWDPGEGWRFDPATDWYGRYEPGAAAGAADATGYGSEWRNGMYDTQGGTYDRDHGRPLVIKPQRPGDEATLSPGFFYPWRFTGNQGAADYRRAFTECVEEEETVLDTDYSVEMGNMVGPTRQAIRDVIALDPDAWWDENGDGGAGAVQGSVHGADWINSSRVLKVALFDPHLIAGIQGGNTLLRFNNIGLFFVEALGAGNEAPVIGRFLFHASGSRPGSGGETSGSLVRVLRLVE